VNRDDLLIAVLSFVVGAAIVFSVMVTAVAVLSWVAQ
jgi:hypothetical protein